MPAPPPHHRIDRVQVSTYFWADPQRLDSFYSALINIFTAVESHARRAGEAPDDLYSTGLNPPNFNLMRS